MHAIILCGGRGERLMPLTAKKPASLLRVAAKEVILYNIEQLKNCGADRITLAVGYGGREIKDFLEGKSFEGVTIDYSYCSDGGSAEAVKYAAANDTEDFLVLEGNCIFIADLSEFLSEHCRRKSLCSVLIDKRFSGDDLTIASVNGEGEVKALVDEPACSVTGSSGCLTGIYAVNPDLFAQQHFMRDADFSDILYDIIRAPFGLIGVERDFYWQRILTPRGFLSCQQNIMYSGEIKTVNNSRNQFSGVTFIPPVYIGENVTIGTGAVIEKGTVVDDGAHIGARCRICSSYIGKNTFIGNVCETDGSVVCEAAVMENRIKCGYNTVVGSGAVVECDCELSRNSQVWADTKVRSGTQIRDRLRRGCENPDYIDDEGTFTVPQMSMPLGGTLRFGLACGSAVDIGDCIVTGHSGKAGSELMNTELKCGIASAGAEVLDLGECTMPQLVYCIGLTGAKIGAYTEMNGHCTVKLRCSGGLPLERSTERKIEKAFSNSSFRRCSSENFGRMSDISGNKKMYEKMIRSILPSSLKGINAVIRTGDPIIAEIADRIFRPINDINGERLIFHISCGGEKCTAYSDKSGNISWETLVCIGEISSFEKGETVSLPFCFPTAADRIAENKNGRLYRFYNSPADSSDKDARASAAQSKSNFVFDGLSLAACICEYLSRKNCSLSQALAEIPEIHTAQRYVPTICRTEEIFKEFGDERAGFSEGAVLANENARAIIRPLKNGGGIIVFAESMMCEQASALCDEISERVAKMALKQSNDGLSR